MSSRVMRNPWLVGAGALLAMAVPFTVQTQDAPPAATQGAPAGQGAGGRGVVQPGGRGPAIGNRGGQMAADPANEAADYSIKPPVTALSPADEAKHFILPPGYKL